MQHNRPARRAHTHASTMFAPYALSAAFIVLAVVVVLDFMPLWLSVGGWLVAVLVILAVDRFRRVNAEFGFYTDVRRAHTEAPVESKDDPQAS